MYFTRIELDRSLQIQHLLPTELHFLGSHHILIKRIQLMVVNTSDISGNNLSP